MLVSVDISCSHGKVGASNMVGPPFGESDGKIGSAEKKVGVLRGDDLSNLERHVVAGSWTRRLLLGRIFVQ